MPVSFNLESSVDGTGPPYMLNTQLPANPFFNIYFCNFIDGLGLGMFLPHCLSTTSKLCHVVLLKQTSVNLEEN